MYNRINTEKLQFLVDVLCSLFGEGLYCDRCHRKCYGCVPCVLTVVQTAPVVGGVDSNNGRRDTGRVSTAGLQLKTCSVSPLSHETCPCLKMNAHCVDPESFLHISEVN